MSTPHDPSPIAIGLKEWAVCCHALAEGRLLLAVRKGGIHEPGGALFAPNHLRFALLPTYLHQQTDRLLPATAACGARALAGDPEPGIIRVAAWAEVARIWTIDQLAPIQALGDALAWSQQELATRFAYRQPGLHVLALAVWVLPVEIRLPDHPSYAGCRSWVSLRQPIDCAGSRPVLDEHSFATRLGAIATVLDGYDIASPATGSADSVQRVAL